tara:strand:- start:133 stop:582 length:450 start_codon:yes stop_codon:yes gene_type:complete
MFNLNKKAVSSIISVTLIIVLSVAAVSLLFSYTNKLSKSSLSTLSPTIDCIKLKTTSSACYNLQNQELEVTVSPGIDESINYLQFSLSSGQGSSSYGCGSSNDFSCSSSCIPPEDKKTKYFIPASETPNELQIQYESCLPEKIKNFPTC